MTSQDHKSGAVHPSPPRWPCRLLYVVPHSCPYMVGCLSSSHDIGTQRETGLAGASVAQYVYTLRRHHISPPRWPLCPLYITPHSNARCQGIR
uniref:Uncharacterized protein n=1 Tax=Mesocestoides corti TaxID=53468 RepID=A0A5K3FUZ2_MESCO